MTRRQFEILTTKMYARLADDRRDLTLSLASGVGIGMGGQDVYRDWLARQSPDPTAKAQNAAERQAAAIQRLQTLFAQQPSAALRGAVKVD